VTVPSCFCVTGCSFTVLVHTRDAATRNMEKVQVIKVWFLNHLSRLVKPVQRRDGFPSQVSSGEAGTKSW